MTSSYIPRLYVFIYVHNIGVVHSVVDILGMKVLYKTFPGGMLTGEVPANCKPTPLGSTRGRKATASSTEGGHAPVALRHRDCFTVEDLEAIQDKLDDALLSSKSYCTGTGRKHTHCMCKLSCHCQ